ncbi:hypothetical protein [Schleiferilactobacillus shenzhenensis]|nr:hypothetical protein [Schleiferilactobacillus shenzhenensis]
MSTSLYPVRSLTDFVCDMLGNQVVTLWALPLALVLISSDLMGPATSSLRSLLLTRQGRVPDLIQPYVRVSLLNAASVTAGTVLLGLLAGWYRGFRFSGALTYPLAHQLGLWILAERLVMLGVFVLLFTLTTVWVSVLTHSPLAAIGADIVLWSIPLIVAKSAPGLLRKFPLFPGAALFWGNYATGKMFLIDFSNLLWLGVAGLLLTVVGTMPRERY